jgi:hypothetical protein
MIVWNHRSPSLEYATCSGSPSARANERHRAYGFRSATIAYPWHPLFEQTVWVSPYRRGKSLTVVQIQGRPGLSRELPNWMFDQAYCAGMSLGLPQVSLAGLAELADLLAAWRKNHRHGARSRPSLKEIGHAKSPPPLPSPAQSGARAAQNSAARGPDPEGDRRSPRRAAARCRSGGTSNTPGRLP